MSAEGSPSIGSAGPLVRNKVSPSTIAPGPAVAQRTPRVGADRPTRARGSPTRRYRSGDCQCRTIRARGTTEISLRPLTSKNASPTVAVPSQWATGGARVTSAEDQPNSDKTENTTRIRRAGSSRLTRKVRRHSATSTSVVASPAAMAAVVETDPASSIGRPLARSTPAAQAVSGAARRVAAVNAAYVEKVAGFH